MLKKRDNPLKSWDEIFALNNVEWKESCDGKSHITIKMGEAEVEFDKKLTPFTDQYSAYCNIVELIDKYSPSDYKIDKSTHNKSGLLNEKTTSIPYCGAYFNASISYSCCDKPLNMLMAS